LKTKALDTFLSQVVGNGILSVMLFNKEGLTVAKAGNKQSTSSGNIYSALLANIWDTYESPGAGSRENLKDITIGCENGIVIVHSVASMLLAIVAEHDAPIGLIKLKMSALAEHLKVPLSSLAT